MYYIITFVHIQLIFIFVFSLFCLRPLLGAWLDRSPRAQARFLTKFHQNWEKKSEARFCFSAKKAAHCTSYHVDIYLFDHLAGLVMSYPQDLQISKTLIKIISKAIWGQIWLLLEKSCLQHQKSAPYLLIWTPSQRHDVWPNLSTR